MKILFTLIALTSSTYSLAERLTLETYLNQVKSNHIGYIGALKKAEAAQERSVDGKLLYALNLFSEAQHTEDHSVGLSPLSPLSPGLKSSSDRASIGLTKQEKFGLEAKAYYSLQRTDFNGSPLLSPNDKITNSSLNLEIKQPLWKNAFGEDLHLQEEQTSLNAKAISANELFNAKKILIDAEKAYWHFARAKELLKIQQESYNRSEKITKFQQNRSYQNLVDEADLLQAKAALKLRELDLKATINEVQLAQKAFNEFLNQPIHKEQTVQFLSSSEVLNANIPQKSNEREDLAAARLNLEAAQKNTQLASNKYKATLDVFGNISLTGKDTKFLDGAGNALSYENTMYLIGLRLNMPLDKSLIDKSRQAYIQETLGAELLVKQKVNETDQNWEELQHKLNNLKDRIRIILELEQAQKMKFDAERTRLRQGRSTTYQIFLFEQDYLNAQISRIQATSQALEVLTDMKTYEDIKL